MSLKDMSEKDLELWIEARFHAELQGLASFRAEMESHKHLLLANSDENKQLLELFRKWKTFIYMMQGLERMAVFFTKIGLWMAMLWAIWTYVVKEAIKQAQGGS